MTQIFFFKISSETVEINDEKSLQENLLEEMETQQVLTEFIESRSEKQANIVQSAFFPPNELVDDQLDEPIRFRLEFFNKNKSFDVNKKTSIGTSTTLEQNQTFD